MKKPKRTAVIVPLNPEDWPFDPPHHAGDMLARWKRKNRIKKYKNTISLLRYRLKDTEDCLKITQKSTKFFLVRPDHWHPMDENGEQLTRKQWKKKNTEKHQN